MPVQGGEDAYALNCRSISAKEPLNIGLFCGNWLLKIRHPLHLCHPVVINLLHHTKWAYCKLLKNILKILFDNIVWLQGGKGCKGCLVMRQHCRMSILQTFEKYSENIIRQYYLIIFSEYFSKVCNMLVLYGAIVGVLTLIFPIYNCGCADAIFWFNQTLPVVMGLQTSAASVPYGSIQVRDSDHISYTTHES